MAQLESPSVNEPPAPRRLVRPLNCAFAVLLSAGVSVRVPAITKANIKRTPRRSCALRTDNSRSDQRANIYSPSICYHAYGVNDIISVNMQPNQQDPNTQPGVSQPQTPAPAQPLPYQVPEYLDLGPIADPAVVAGRKRRKSFLFLAVVMIVIAVATGAIALYMYAQNNSPQKRFLKALDEQMQVSYIERNIVVSKDDKSTAVNIRADMSDPKQIRSDMAFTERSSGKVVSDVKVLTLNDKRYMFQVKSVSAGEVLSTYSKGQWYSASFHAAGRSEVKYSIDEKASPLVLNSVQGLVLTGSFTKNAREQLLEYIQANDVYPISSEQTETDGSKKLIGYTVQLDLEKINALNAKAAQVLGLAQVFAAQKPYPKYQKVVFWVADRAKGFAKITYNSGEDEGSVSAKQEMTFKESSKVLIETPTNVKELSS